jgi:hypothetical protein
MLALLDAVAAAAMQAFASDSNAPREPGELPPVKVWKIGALIDTCWSYRADGEVMQQLRRRHGD